MSEKFGSTEALPAERPCDHPVSEFEATAREIASMIYATAALTRSSAIVAISTALSEAVAAEREACLKITDFGVKYEPADGFSVAWHRCADETAYLLSKAIRSRAGGKDD